MQFNRREVPIKQWSGEHLGQILAVDTETDVRPFYEIAELQTMQVYNGKAVYYVMERDVYEFYIVHEASIQIMHNAPFDLDVISTLICKDRSFIYHFLDRKKVFDTNILYKLWHLAHIGFTPKRSSLAHCCSSLLGIELDKNTDIRCTFEQYKNVPISEIPVEHLEYGAKDAVATWDLYFVLMSRIKQYDTYNTLLSYDIQIKGAVALNQMYKNGIGFDLEQRDVWLQDMDKKLQIEADILASWGWVRGKKGIKEIYENIIDYIGLRNVLPRTEDGSISSKAEDLEKYNDSPFISSYLRFHELEKATSFVRDLSVERVHPDYNLLVNTGRTSCSKPNFQQLPKMGGVREMFVAEKGKTFGIVDYSAIELATLSQVLLDKYGYTVMGEKINEGIDLHKYYASVMHNCTIDSVTKQWRQEAKAANFGFPGGLGIGTFIEFSRSYGLTLTEDQASEMKSTWFEAFPEVRDYMASEMGYVYTRSGRRRANTTYCAEKNTPFQGLAADGAKLALYNLCKAGFKLVGFCHDEIVCEIDEIMIDSKIREMEKIMIDSMREVVPDIKVGVESMISPFYTK